MSVCVDSGVHFHDLVRRGDGPPIRIPPPWSNSAILQPYEPLPRQFDAQMVRGTCSTSLTEGLPGFLLLAWRELSALRKISRLNTISQTFRIPLLGGLPLDRIMSTSSPDADVTGLAPLRRPPNITEPSGLQFSATEAIPPPVCLRMDWLQFG